MEILEVLPWNNISDYLYQKLRLLHQEYPIFTHKYTSTNLWEHPQYRETALQGIQPCLGLGTIY
jgi:hypothetical protein